MAPNHPISSIVKISQILPVNFPNKLLAQISHSIHGQFILFKYSFYGNLPFDNNGWLLLSIVQRKAEEAAEQVAEEANIYLIKQIPLKLSSPRMVER